MKESQALSHLENPVYRLRIKHHLAPKILAERANITLQTVYDAERGVLANVPVTISVYFGVKPGVMNHEYRKWKTLCRKTVMVYDPDRPEIMRALLSGMEHGVHPFITWYERSEMASLADVCRVLKLQRKSVLNYTKGTQKSMPQEIQDALSECIWVHRGNLVTSPGNVDFVSQRRSALDTLIRLGNDFQTAKSRERLEESRITRELEQRDGGPIS